MANLVFEGEVARIAQGFAQRHDLIVRRSAVLEALNLRSGERVLEQGCGAGYYTYEAARFVGPQGRVAAIDISADQLTAARDRCREMAWVECRVTNANELPYSEGEFDAVFGVQVLEYIQDFEKAACEAHRIDSSASSKEGGNGRGKNGARFIEASSINDCLRRIRVVGLGSGEVALLHHCERYQLPVGPAAHTPERTGLRQTQTRILL